MALIFVFSSNPKTASLLEFCGAYPNQLRNILQQDDSQRQQKPLQIKQDQVIAKLVKLVRNLETKQGRISAEHESWNEKWITGYFRRTLISYWIYESGKSYAMSGFKLRMFSGCLILSARTTVMSCVIPARIRSACSVFSFCVRRPARQRVSLMQLISLLTTVLILQVLSHSSVPRIVPG